MRGVGLEEREGVAGLAPPPPYCALKCGEEGGLGPALLGQEAWQGKKKKKEATTEENTLLWYCPTLHDNSQ